MAEGRAPFLNGLAVISGLLPIGLAFDSGLRLDPPPIPEAHLIPPDTNYSGEFDRHSEATRAPGRSPIRRDAANSLSLQSAGALGAGAL